MLVLLLLPLVLATCVAAPLVKAVGPRAFAVLAVAPATSTLLAALLAPDAVDGTPVLERHTWVPGIGLGLDLRLDTLSLTLTLIATGIGTLVLVYCAGYFDRDAAKLPSFATSLVAFATAMTGLVLADNLLLLYVLWELTTVTSYLLIGYDDRDRSARHAALQALVVTTLGGLAMLAGLITWTVTTGSASLTALLADPPEPTAANSCAAVLVLLGAFTKSAQWPFHFWLPRAMAAPTPVSAYLHAAAMVKAGVYLVARLAPAAAHLAPWRALVLTLGLLTLVWGAWNALRQTDLKLLLAHGTTSQLGLLTAMLGTGTHELALAGAGLLVAHAVFKAPLFLAVGAVDHATGTRDLRRLARLGRHLPLLATAAVAAAAAMAALPPFLAFAAKETALYAWSTGAPGGWWALVATAVGSALTTAYSIRFALPFLTAPPRVGPPPQPRPPHPRRGETEPGAGTRGDGERTGGEGDRPEPGHAVPGHAGAWLVGPVVLLSAAGLALGLLTGAVDSFLAGYAAAFPTPSPYHLALWHGWTLPLAVTALVLAGGVAGHLLTARGRPAEGLALADRAYRHTVTGANKAALRVTAAVQSGSLPRYLAIVLGTLAAALAATAVAVLATGDAAPLRFHLWDTPVQAVAAAGIVVGCVLVVRTDRRLTAVLLAGTVGYELALLFAVHGAPDLALTQFLVETVTLIAFVLVLRRLPRTFSRRPRATRAARLVLAAVAAALLTGTLAAGLNARRAPAVSAEFLARSEPEAHGKEVVNVILVDFRAFDTLGEISVLAVTSIGVASMVMAGSGRSGGRGSGQGDAGGDGGPGPRSGAEGGER
ncbi:hydrogen gas-evolving membrane-bound hydrogenase subunit E [Allostreptomyces psammosilenae]|uniref:Multicomponent Na+:H+ antiporter subunit A n=1 Tax=Allostreptomyces psammosilenae TaxID=1892865 RepID=A0A853A1C2_9ACTN|nr:hydrogen gas-evolving membrane-bound hydrogenase subunit E [Allostreptomyces psammosilenae]NYI04312.1 multicomponent Na+:H+ antiporter subunit A [Allostreptomyces psammosilenae]